MMMKETRSLEFEIRAEETGNEERAGRITGTPIVFNQVMDAGWMRETIDRGALDKTDLRDVRFLVGHDTSSIPLARSRNNNANSTMQLSVTDEGMEIRVDLDIENNPRAKELYSAVKRGDISGMSFMFTVDEDSWEGLDTDSPMRHIRSISKVFEVSAVTFPAYEGTSIQAAAEGGALESAKASLESAKQRLADERAEEAEQERRTAVLDWLKEYMGPEGSGKEEESENV